MQAAWVSSPDMPPPTLPYKRPFYTVALTPSEIEVTPSHRLIYVRAACIAIRAFLVTCMHRTLGLSAVYTQHEADYLAPVYT